KSRDFGIASDYSESTIVVTDFVTTPGERGVNMADTNRKPVLARVSRIISFAGLLLVPAVALAFFGSALASVARGRGRSLDRRPVAPVAASKPTPVARKATAEDGPEIHLAIWEDTSDRRTQR